MHPTYSSPAQEDRDYWEKHDVSILERIEKLMTDIQKNSYAGIGKPEALRFTKSGYWSRRINQELRLIYKILDGDLYIMQCRYYYKK